MLSGKLPAVFGADAVLAKITRKRQAYWQIMLNLCQYKSDRNRRLAVYANMHINSQLSGAKTGQCKPVYEDVLGAPPIVMIVQLRAFIADKAPVSYESEAGFHLNTTNAPH